MSLIATLAAVAALTVPADDLSDLKPVDKADLQCMGVMVFMIGASEDDETKSLLSAGATYYYGRLEGRTPDQNWVARVRTYLLSEPYDDLEANRGRCAEEMRTMGQLFTAIASSDN